jgi:uncharacterized membrane protein YheB (UPF0754 family)
MLSSMADPWLTWTVVPAVGALIGYGTNRLAVRMIFRPLEPRKILGLRVQGLVGRRQPDLAEAIGRVVGGHLVKHEDLVSALGKVDLRTLVDQALSKGLEPRIAELRALPMVGGFLTDERVGDLRRRFVDGILEDTDGLVEVFERALESGLDVQRLVREKVAEFEVVKLESLVLDVAARELRSIELLGAVLGLLIGLLQAALLTWV